MKNIKQLKCSADSPMYNMGADHQYDVIVTELTDRAKLLNNVFLGGIKMDKSPARTQREAYFHQLGKFEIIKSFLNLPDTDFEPKANPWVDRKIQSEERMV